MITLKLTDSTASLVLNIPEVPIAEDTIENATDVQTLDFNVYTDFIAQKRQWTHTWKYLSEDDYNALRGFYNRQFTLFAFPKFTIDYYGIIDVPVRMALNTKNTIDNCGEIADVTIILRETV